MGQRVQAQPTEGQMARVCQALGWQLLRVGTYGGETGYLVLDETGITEPHSAREIVQTAIARGVIRRRRRQARRAS